MVDSNKYWALFEEKEKGAPLSLSEGILHTEFIIKDPFAPLPSDYGDWRTAVNTLVTLPKQLWFVTRDKLYTFDLRFSSGGFIVSETFYRLLQTHISTPYISTLVNVVNKHGKSVVEGNYYYIRFYGYTDVIDHTNSNIIYDSKGFIKKPLELSLKQDIRLDVFMTDSSFFFNRLFCIDKFREACLDVPINGIKFIEVLKAGVYKPSNI